MKPDIQDNQKKLDISKNAEIIERTLDAFGLRTRVVEIHTTKDTIQYCLEIVMGTPTSDILSHANDLGLALATIDGTVDIQAPIPGRALVGITMKKPSSVQIDAKDRTYIMIPTSNVEVITFDNIERLRNGIVRCIGILVQILLWLMEKIQSPYKTDSTSNYDIKVTTDNSGTIHKIVTKKDPLYSEAVTLCKKHEYISVDLLQKKFSIGYARSSLLLDRLEDEGIIEKYTGTKRRKVIK